MPFYDVRLKDPKSEQWRLFNAEADSERHAAALALRNEVQLVEFTLSPNEVDAPAEPPDDASVEVLVQWLNAREAYAQRAKTGVTAVNLAGELEDGPSVLAELEKEHGVDSKGKAFGPSTRGKLHLFAHRQHEPYEIVEVTERDLEPERLVRAVLDLQANPHAWERALKALKDGGVPLAAVTAVMYGLWSQKQLSGSATTVWSSGTIQCSLHTAYTLDQDAHDFFDDVSATELAATGGYTTLGVTLGTKTNDYTSGTDVAALKAANVSWTSSTLSATDAIIWENTGGASTTDPLMGAIDFGATVTTTNGTFQITWDATGIFTLDTT